MFIAIKNKVQSTYWIIKGKFSCIINNIKSFIRKHPRLEKILKLIKKGFLYLGARLFDNAEKISVGIGAVMILITVLVVGLRMYFLNRFYPNTYINDLYCCGYTEEYASNFLSKAYSDYNMILHFDDKDLSLNAGVYINPYNFLEDTKWLMLKQQELPFLRTINIRHDFKFEPDLDISEELKDYWRSITDYEYKEQYFYYMNDFGFIEEENGLDHIFMPDKAYNLLLHSIRLHKTEIDLTEKDFYYNVKPTEEQRKAKKRFSVINNYQNAGISYDMGSNIMTISPAQMCSFLVFDNDLPAFDAQENLKINERSVKDFLKEMFSDYQTVGKEHKFITHNGESIILDGMNYGNEIDLEEEEDYLINILNELARGNKVSTANHTPAYTKKAYAQGINDIGDDYIEISQEEQCIYVYRNGICEFESDILTGNEFIKAGIYPVELKQTDRLIFNVNYDTFSSYWMQLSGGFEMFSASWRNLFGKEEYKSTQTAGGIEIPEDAMEKIYDYAKKGIPVIIY